MSLCRQKQLEQSEGRASVQRGELSAVRETHQKGEVERELLEEERAQLKEALVRVNRGHLLIVMLVQCIEAVQFTRVSNAPPSG